jgi:hypothetical protein
MSLHSQPLIQRPLSPAVKAVLADVWEGLTQRDLEGLQ